MLAMDNSMHTGMTLLLVSMPEHKNRILNYCNIKLQISKLGTRSCTSAGQGSLNTDHPSLSWLNLSLAHWKKWLNMCTLEHLAKMDLKFLNNNIIIINRTYLHKP